LGICSTRKADVKLKLHESFEETYKGTEGREVSTTMVFIRILAKHRMKLVN
jgi:hypothetical protein